MSIHDDNTANISSGTAEQELINITPPPREYKKLIRIITICAFPAVLTALFFALRGSAGVMDGTARFISRPLRSFLGLISSPFPFSAAEILIALAAIWVLYYIVKSIVAALRSGKRLKTALMRLLVLITAAMYVWCGFCWLWGTAYYETGFAAKNGFSADGVKAEDLTRTAQIFQEQANALAQQIPRGADGRFETERSVIFENSQFLYQNPPFAGLENRNYKPKPMLFSKLMSRTGFTGFYFALTGEASVNIDAPVSLMPATIAHELAHQRGVAAEEEANFIAVAACLSSGDTIYEYSGYLMGLIHLMNALFSADFDAWSELRAGFTPELERDWNYNSEYWQSQKTVDTGVEFIDTTLTAVTEAAEETVTAFYDGYLKSYGQSLGIRSYGACVNLLVQWSTANY